jgi:C4-dicarboxylate-binding protein DctP
MKLSTPFTMLAWFIGLVLAVAAGPAAAAEPILIRFSHVVAANTPKGKAALLFKRLAEERSGGAVRVEVYPNSQLYKDREEIEALQLGAVQMLAPSLSKFGSLGIDSFELFDLPYIFPNKATLYRVMDGDIGRRLFDRLAAKGIVGLAYWDNGFKHMSANRPLRSVEDFKGLKMRVQTSQVLEAQMRALGATPQVMAFSDVYPALQQGLVDGSENPLSNFHTKRLHEVQKHLTLSQHGYLGYAVIVNKAFWEGLPADIRTLLTQVMQEVTTYERGITEQEAAAALAAVQAAGTTRVYVLPLAERIKWWQAMLPVHKAFEERIGKDLIQATYQAAAAVDREQRARPK